MIVIRIMIHPSKRKKKAWESRLLEVENVLTASACYGYVDNGVMIAAASDALWNNGSACGRMYSVRCTGATNQGVRQPCNGCTVTVKIVDYCSPGCGGTTDLSREAFSNMVDLNAGKIQIEYNE